MITSDFSNFECPRRLPLSDLAEINYYVIVPYIESVTAGTADD